jgi:hypothetical protein
MGLAGRWRVCTAAHKVHDFESIAIFKSGGLPLGARNDFQIQFNGDAIRLHAELRDQRSYAQAIGKIAFFAVDVESHGQLANSNWQLALSEIPKCSGDLYSSIEPDSTGDQLFMRAIHDPSAYDLKSSSLL